jgi:hypothetical protein
MNQRIIYPNSEGGVSILVPAPECGLSIEEIAAKDVPAGKPYKIVDVADIPSDRTFRNAWEFVADEPVQTEPVQIEPVQIEPTPEVSE